MPSYGIAIEVEVVDAPLDYNLLLGQNWMYSMQAVASSLFRVVCFPFNGKIVTIDQTSFKNPSVNASLGASIPSGCRYVSIPYGDT